MIACYPVLLTCTPGGVQICPEVWCVGLIFFVGFLVFKIFFKALGGGGGVSSDDE